MGREVVKARCCADAADACGSSHAPVPVPPSPVTSCAVLKACLQHGAQTSLPGLEEVQLVQPAMLPLHVHRVGSGCSSRPARFATTSTEFGPSRWSRVPVLLRPRLTPPGSSGTVSGTLLRIVRRSWEVSQGKTLLLRLGAARFTNARVWVNFGRPRPMPGYPTAPA